MWSGGPTFAYQWSRDGTPLAGATGRSYAVHKIDEGSTLTCTVTASDAAGAGRPATSAAVRVAAPHVRGCPAAGGWVNRGRLGRVALGMTRRQARRIYRHNSTRGRRYEDFFCLTPIGIRVGYASPKLLRTLSARERRRLHGRIVWISTSNPRYAVREVRAGESLPTARRRLRHGHLLRIGRNDWYLAPAGASTAVLKVRHGVVEEIGIATKQLTRGRRAEHTFMTAFR